MRPALRAALLAALLLPAAAEAGEAPPAVTLHPSAEGALAEALRARPRVVAFGEYHQTHATVKLTSPLRRFTEQLLPGLAPRAADIVVETWVTQGQCGKQEEAVATEVPKTTQRPAATESELVTMIKRAKAGGVAPHILTLSCKDYEGLLDDKGAVDYEKLLALLRDLLAKGAKEALARLDRAAGKDAAGTEAGGKEVAVGKEAADRLVLIYGGALHNDLEPDEAMRRYAFGQELQEVSGGRYLEIDLYVPEYVDKDPQITKQRWWAAYRRAARPGKVALVRRGPASYAILFPRGQK